MASATGLYAFPVTGRSLTIRWVFWLTMSILVSSSVCGNQQKLSPESRLHKRLLFGYNKLLRPLEGKNTTTVHFSVMLNDINEIREGTLEAVMKASVWVSMHWKDERLAWSMGQYPVETIVIDPNKIWRPDIRLYNNLDPKIRMDDKVKALLYHDGSIRYDVPMWLIVHCYRPRVPSATWECPFRFGSWVYHGYQLDIYIHDEGMDLSQYADRVWGISGNQSSRKAITKKCCREPWPEIKYILRLIRR